jgi:hypothetical protein
MVVSFATPRPLIFEAGRMQTARCRSGETRRRGQGLRSPSDATVQSLQDALPPAVKTR